MNQAAKIGLFMVLALAALAFLILRIEDLNLFAEPGRRLEATFDSVAGLDDKSTVRVAGVRVGKVDGIRLENEKAIVTLVITEPLTIRRGARAKIANLGLLGDKFVLLELGPSSAPLLATGERLVGETPPSFDDAMAQVGEIGSSIESALGSLNLGGEGGLLGDGFGRMLDNVDATVTEIRTLVAANRGQVDSTMASFASFSSTLAEELPRLTAQIEHVLGQVDEVMGENRGNLKEGLDTVIAVTGKLRTSVENLNQITGKIAAGEGTLGKLVNSGEAHDTLVSTLGAVQEGVASLGDTLGRVRSLKLDVGFNSYYLQELEDSRTAFSLQLAARDDRFYLVEAVDDPFGRTRVRTDTVTTTLDDGTSSTEEIRRVKVEDKLTLSAQFGFRYGNADLRAGLIESTGGAGIDYSLFDQRVRLSMEAFDFSREGDLDPHLRILGRLHLTDNLYLLGGYDDFLVDERESIFLGAGLRWSDDDLKYLLGSLPSGF